MRRIAALLVAGALVAPATAHSTPVDCADPCGIEVVSVEYLPPVAVLASGTTVHWTTNTESHPTADTADPNIRCFQIAVGHGVPAEPVRFDVVDDDVVATTFPGTVDASTQTCTSAVVLQDGEFALPFVCLLHAWMRGALVIHA